jgi:hypothetical protein
MKTIILFVKIDFLIRHFVFDNIPESPIIKNEYIHDNTDYYRFCLNVFRASPVQLKLFSL